MEVEDGERWCVTLDRGTLGVSGDVPDAECVVRTDRATLEGMVEGRVNATAALLRGLVQAEGDVELLIYLQRLFPSPPGTGDVVAAPVGGVHSMTDWLVSILDGNTFVVSDKCGDIEATPTDPTGLFAWDTRFLSRWVLTVNGERLASLSIDELQYFQARFFLVAGTGTVYVDAKLSVIRTRSVGQGFHEELTILNHAEEPAELAVRVEAGSDFADLFEVKDALAKKGNYSTRIEDDVLVLAYQRERYQRETRISANQPTAVDEQGLTFNVQIPPKQRWSVGLEVVTALAESGERLVGTKHGQAPRKRRPNMEHDLELWIANAPTMECDWDPLKRTYRRSLIDLAALRFSPLSAGAAACPLPACPGS